MNWEEQQTLLLGVKWELLSNVGIVLQMIIRERN